MITDYLSYKQYFANLAFSDPDVASWIMDDDLRVLGAQRSELEYPIMELVRPSYEAIRVAGGVHKKVYRGALSILNWAAKDDHDREEQIILQVEAVIDRMIARLDADDLTRRQTIVPYPIRNNENDNLWGWGFEFEVETIHDFCLVTSALYSLQRWTPVFTGGETELQATVNSTLYSVPCLAEDSMPESVKALALAIVAGEADVMAREDQGDLVLTGRDVGVAIDATTGPTGHSWTIYN